ncbi:hypothetical protein KM043_008421 [Ampulex compressa]|nr:hypothetical protein KM043_008421 [Ampulex compressa]
MSSYFVDIVRTAKRRARWDKGDVPERRESGCTIGVTLRPSGFPGSCRLFTILEDRGGVHAVAPPGMVASAFVLGEDGMRGSKRRTVDAPPDVGRSGSPDHLVSNEIGETKAERRPRKNDAIHSRKIVSSEEDTVVPRFLAKFEMAHVLDELYPWLRRKTVLKSR